MEKSFCFNSINGDRKYKAEDFREYFATFIGNGVFPNPSTNLQCIGENGDMTVTLKKGPGWINGALYVNDNDLILPIDVADGVLNRIDRIVLRMDTIGRAINAVVKKGTFASSPVASDLQRDADAYELGLADVYIAAGATSIAQAKITDLRLNSSYCGVVTGTVDQVDTTTIFNQYLDWFTSTKTTSETEINNMEAQFQSDFNTWFDTIKNTLGSDVAGNLLNLINQNTASISNLQDEVDTHKAEKATQNTLGHVKVDNESIKVDENGTISAQKPIDYGRYQADFGLDNAVLNNVINSNNTINLIDKHLTTIEQNNVVNTINVWGTTCWGERLNTVFTANIREINYIELYFVGVVGTPTSPVIVEIFDETSSILLGSKSLPSTSFATGNQFIKFIFDTPIQIANGHVLQIRVSSPSSSSSNYYHFAMSNTAPLLNAENISTTTAWGSTTTDTASDLTFKINYTDTLPTMSGTVTKTVTPSDIKKWGNVKWTQTTLSTGSTVTCNIYKSDGTTLLLSNVTSIADLSSVDVTANPTIVIKWTLTRVNITDASPTISNTSVTWEGKGYNGIGMWEKITDIIVPSNTSSVVISNIPSTYKKFRMTLKLLSNYVSTPGNIRLTFNDAISNYNYMTISGSAYTSTQYANILLANILANGGSYTVCEFTNTESTTNEIIGSAIGATQIGAYLYQVPILFSSAIANATLINKITLATSDATSSILAGSEIILWGCK